MSQKLKDLLHKVEHGGEIKKEVLISWVKEAVEDDEREKIKTEAIKEMVNFGFKCLSDFGKGVIKWYDDLPQETKDRINQKLIK